MKLRLLLEIVAAGALALGGVSSRAGVELGLDVPIPGDWDSAIVDRDGASPKILQLLRQYPDPIGPLIDPNSGQGPSNAVHAATQFLYACAPNLTVAHLDLTNSLVLSEVLQDHNLHYPERGMDYCVVFKQQYGSLPVYEGECRVALNNHYVIWQLRNDLQEITCPPQTPKLSEAEAFTRVQARYAGVTTNLASPGSLFYFSPTNLVWGFYLPSYGRMAKIDAVTGAVVGEDLNVIPVPGYTLSAVAFNNYDANHPVYYLETNRFAGTGCYVEVLGGPDPAHLQPVLPLNAGLSPVLSLAEDEGWFDAGVGIVPGVEAGGQAWFQVMAWKGEGTTNGWQDARERVVSDVFQQFTGTACINLGLMCEVGVLSFPVDLVIRPARPSAGPTLKMTRSGDRLILSWPNTDSGFKLESTDCLAAPHWVPVAETPGAIGNERVLTTAIVESARCFRLKK